MNKEIINPKYNSKNLSLLYKYYAGFSTEFVEDIVSGYPVSSMTILDPWNGSGTTSRVSAILGANSIYGFDINPAMVVVSIAEMLSINEYREIKINKTQYLYNQDVVDDPLEAWFTRTSVRNIRNVEMGFRRELLNVNELQLSNSYFILENDIKMDIFLKNKLLAFYYLAFFETIKNIAVKFKSSNPTWIKVAKNPEEKIKISQRDFEVIFLKQIKQKVNVLKKRPPIITQEINIKTVDSRNLKLQDNSVDLVITSPPYCTRIDYTISTRLELAILGFYQDEQFENLRKKMIGTTKIIKDCKLSTLNLSETAQKFIKNVSSHDSKASNTYYKRQFTQYFEGITQSISELNRVCKEDAVIYIVVQDSYYKDIYLDIATIFKEIFERYNWNPLQEKTFEKKQAMVSVNKNTKKYRSITNPKEIVLAFERRM